MRAHAHECAESFRAAAFAAARDTRDTSRAVVMLRQYADACGLAMPARVKPASLTIPAARAAIIDTAHALTCNPSPSTLRAFLRVLAALDMSLLRTLDRLPSRLMPENARGEPAPSPRPRNLPPCALTWQTSPAIGVNPMLVAMLNEHAARVAAKARR